MKNDDGEPSEKKVRFEHSTSKQNCVEPQAASLPLDEISKVPSFCPVVIKQENIKMEPLDNDNYQTLPRDINPVSSEQKAPIGEENQQRVFIKQEIDAEPSSPTSNSDQCLVNVKIERCDEESLEDKYLEIDVAPSSSKENDPTDMENEVNTFVQKQVDSGHDSTEESYPEVERTKRKHTKRTSIRLKNSVIRKKIQHLQRKKQILQQEMVHKQKIFGIMQDMLRKKTEFLELKLKHAQASAEKTSWFYPLP